jgi:hypothetical protein
MLPAKIYKIDIPHDLALLKVESSFYADTVDYFDNGVVSRDLVAQDVFKYDRRWRRYWVTSGPLVSIADPSRDMVKAIVRLAFKVQNQQKQVVGACENTIYIQDANSNPKVISVRSKDVESPRVSRAAAVSAAVKDA